MPGIATVEEADALYDTITAARPDNQTSAGTSGLINPFLGTPPTLNPPYDMSDPAEHDRLFQDTLNRRVAIEAMRLAPPRVRLWDGDFNLRGEVAGWRDVDYEFIENDTGTATLQLSLSHYLALWVMNFAGRDKRNVIVTIDKQGSRWSGFMDNYKVVSTTANDAYLEITFKHDYEQSKHIYCWCNPFLRPEVQFPKLWIAFGPSKWCLLLTLFVNIFRLESALWSLPDNPLDINEWLDLDTSTWRNVVKPFPLVEDNSNLAIVFTRFKTWHDLAKPILEDAQLTVVCRRYLKGEDPHPFLDLQGELDTPTTESFEASFPLRNGCLVWDIQDNSGWGTETAFGGSLETGLIRAVVTIASDGFTEGVDVFEGDPTYPGEYYTPEFLGTSPDAPWVIYDVASPYTGVTSSEFQYFEATDVNFLTGGHSMPGVNEGISAAINMGGDFLTSLINTWIGTASSVSVDGGFGAGAGISVPAIDIPPLGGVIDAVAKIFYEDVFLAFMQIPSLREIGTPLPLPGLEQTVSGLGAFHYYEGWGDGADRAFTLAAFAAIRAKVWATRAHSAHKIKVSDAAPYIIGEPGYGQLWLGNRVGTTVPNFPIPYTVFVERVGKLKYGWGKDGARGWQMEIGYREPQDPALKALSWIREINSGLGTLGIL